MGMDGLSPLIGPFFYIAGKLICHAVPLSEGETRGDKLDDPYGHDRLWDDHFRFGDYIDYPRGRVVWDCAENRGIIYIDRCIDRPAIVEKIRQAFGLTDCAVARDDHYRCRRCAGDPFAD